MMQLFQLSASAFLLGVAIKWAYNVLSDRHFYIEVDKYGRRHKRDLRNGQFVKL